MKSTIARQISQEMQIDKHLWCDGNSKWTKFDTWQATQLRILIPACNSKRGHRGVKFIQIH